MCYPHSVAPQIPAVSKSFITAHRPPLEFCLPGPDCQSGHHLDPQDNMLYVGTGWVFATHTLMTIRQSDDKMALLYELEWVSMPAIKCVACKHDTPADWLLLHKPYTAANTTHLSTAKGRKQRSLAPSLAFCSLLPVLRTCLLMHSLQTDISVLSSVRLQTVFQKAMKMADC